MATWNIRVLDSSYRTVKDALTNELFGRTDTGESITVVYTGFEPYFYVVEPDPSVIRTLESDKRVKRLEKTVLEVHGEKKECRRVVVDYPWSVKSIRERLSGRVKVLAADILFAHRFIYDMDIGACVAVEGEEMDRGDYTTDLVVRASGPGSFSEIPDFKPELKILSFDIENSIRTEELLTIGVVMEYADIRRTYHFEGSEAGMIESLTKVIREEDPDVITGYNIDGYDIPHLIKRWKAINNKEEKSKETGLMWGRDGSAIRDSTGRMWHVTGRIVADAWLHVRKEFHPKQETLNHVSKILLGEEKMDVVASDMDHEWAENREKVIEYCIKDADLALRLLKKTAALHKYMDLATVSRLPLDVAMNSGSSTLIDSLLIRMADRRGVAVPMNSYGRRREKIEGGYVHAIEPGLYHWVCVLDFKSMYPSLMIAKNICFSTVVSDEDAEEGVDYIVSPNGTRFLPKERKVGLIPELLQKLMAERDEAKKKMKQAEKEGNTERYRYYNGLQAAIKVLMNSFYGVFASSFYRFTDRRIGASITAFARESTKYVITTLEKENIEVVYGDTDSVFFVSPFRNLEETVEFGTDIATRFSREGATLEFEKILEPLFSHGKKKRYVGRIVWPEEDIIIRGYEIRRTDSFNLQSTVLMGVFERILDEDIEGAVDYAKNAVRDIMGGRVKLEDLVISRTCKPFNSYKNPDSQLTVQTAKKMIERGYEFIPGMKVSWIVVNGSVSPQVVEPYISGVPFEKKPDYMYYAKRVATNIGRVTEVFGWDERRLLSGISQETLFSDSFSRGRSDSTVAPRKKSQKKVKSRLEDFI